MGGTTVRLPCLGERAGREADALPGADDLYGPIIVCTVIFLAVLVNFILRVNQRFVPSLSGVSWLS